MKGGRENVFRLEFEVLRLLVLTSEQPFALIITRNMGQDGDGHAHFDQIWRPNITINYMGVDQNIKF
jgi:hypothetical protein